MSVAFSDLCEETSVDDNCCIRSRSSSTFGRAVSATDSPVDLAAIKAAVRIILRAVGEDPDRDGLLETPRRVAKMYAEMFSGLSLDPGRHLEVTFQESYDEIVLVRDIPFTSMCEHHLLPFRGVAATVTESVFEWQHRPLQWYKSRIRQHSQRKRKRHWRGEE